MHWRLEFIHERTPDAALVSRVLFFLVSRGVRYNTVSASGWYMILPHDEDNEQITGSESGESDCTECLGDIIEQYRKFDPETTSLTIVLDFEPERGMPFTLSIVPAPENKSRIKMRTHQNFVPNEAVHDAFVYCTKDLFSRLGFVYGSYSNENQPSIPTDEQALLERPVQAITFYDSGLVDLIGRERLLSIPAGHAEELYNGGVFLYICDNQFGGCDDLDVVREFLASDSSLDE
jgi:hypothetical protein